MSVPPGSKRSKAGAGWNWMKQFRTWKANRKVFLYPENSLEPEVRDDNTSTAAGERTRRSIGDP